MKILMKSTLALCALAALGLESGQALAGCGFVPSQLKPNAWNPPAQALPTLQSAVYRPETAGRLLLISDDGGWPGQAGVVGMWRFQLVSHGVVVDDGYAQWHSDGTEIQNSGLHAPITSNFCLGVWKEVRPGTYQLNHFPLGWDATGQSPANAIQVTETVKLSDQNHMTGTFTLKVYVWTTTDSLNVGPPSIPVATVTGTVTATRVTIDSTVPGSTK